MNRQKARAAVRRMLKSGDNDLVLQGIELLSTLEDPALIEDVLGAVEVHRSAQRGDPSQRRWVTWVGPRRLEAASWGFLQLLGAAPEDGARAGRVRAEIQRLKLCPLEDVVDLERLDRLPALESIWICTRNRYERRDEPIAVRAPGALARFPALRELRAEKSHLEIAELPPIALDSLRISEGPLTTLTPPLGFSAREVRLVACRAPRSLTPRLPGTTALTLADSRGLAVLAAGELGDLEHAELHGNQQLEQIPGLAGAPLRTLRLSNCVRLTSIAPLRGAPLEQLDLAGCLLLADLDGLEAATGLQRLSLASCALLHSLEGLPAAPALAALSLEGCEQLRDARALQGLSGLRSLDLRGCSALEDLDAALSLADLRVLALHGTRFTPADVPPARRAICTWAPDPLMDELAARPVPDQPAA